MYCTRMKCFFDKKCNIKLELGLPTDIQNIIEDYKRGFEKVEYNWYKFFRSLSGYQLATVRDTLHIDDFFNFKQTIPRVLTAFPKRSRIYHKALKALTYWLYLVLHHLNLSNNVSLLIVVKAPELTRHSQDVTIHCELNFFTLRNFLNATAARFDFDNCWII